MKVKICGITRQEDALAAVRAGADAVGFIFVRSSKRWIEPEKARAIIGTLPPSVIPVGVFVNAGRDAISAIIEVSGIRLIQLHGEESPEEASSFPLPVWKGFRVGPSFDLGSLAAYQVEGYLLDSYVAGMHGGSGRRFDWNVAVAAKKYGRVILSGGITPENVGEAMRDVAPYAIDVSSGVESSPGLKDEAKMRQLFKAVKESLC